MKPVFSSVMLIVAMVILLSDGLTLADVPEQISVATMPPVVVKTVPQSGDKNVDPSIREIRVTFSKDMMDGSWSWTQISDETFPKMAGKPRYLADKRTCVLPVKLEPGRSYVTWINSAKFGNFRDADGRSAVPYLLVFETAGKAQAAQGPGVADMAMGQPKRPWGPEQATGAPDTSRAGDFPTAWASLTADGQREWLLLEYAEPIKPQEIRVYENYHPGALSKISVFDPDGKEVKVWTLLYLGKRVETSDGYAGGSRVVGEGGVVISKFPVKVDFTVQRVKLHLDSPRVKGWNEIDAVGLVDEKGNTHWATRAEASSTYSSRHGVPGGGLRPRPQTVQIPAGAVRLGYVDDSPEGRRSIGGSGHAVLFDRSAEADHVVAVQIFASRYGYPQPPAEDFHVYLLDKDQKVIKDLPYPYSMIERGPQRWYTLKVPAVEVPEQFYVALSFNPHQTKGVYVGIDENVDESHSYVGLPASGFTKVDGKYDWMVRAYLAANPFADYP